MGVDYVQDRDCGVKRALGLDHLISLLKSRAHAELLLAQLKKAGENPAGATIRRVVLYPSGPVEEEVDLAALLEAGERLAPFAPLCDGCTANFREEPFGCCGYLNYPISDPEERWLMARLPESLHCAGGIYLRSTLRQLDIDGAPVSRMRQDPYFQRTAPVIRQWEEAGDTLEVTSDQMLQLVFYSGGLTPLHAVLLCLFLGFIPHDIDSAAMQRIVESPDRMQDHLAIDADALSVLEGTQLGMFLMGMMSAAINNEALLIDA